MFALHIPPFDVERDDGCILCVSSTATRKIFYVQSNLFKWIANVELTLGFIEILRLVDDQCMEKIWFYIWIFDSDQQQCEHYVAFHAFSLWKFTVASNALDIHLHTFSSLWYSRYARLIFHVFISYSNWHGPKYLNIQKNKSF